MPNLPRCSSTKYLNSVLCQGAVMYGKLPSDVRSMSSLPLFCKKIKRDMLSAY